MRRAHVAESKMAFPPKATCQAVRWISSDEMHATTQSLAATRMNVLGLLFAGGGAVYLGL